MDPLRLNLFIPDNSMMVVLQMLIQNLFGRKPIIDAIDAPAKAAINVTREGSMPFCFVLIEFVRTVQFSLFAFAIFLVASDRLAMLRFAVSAEI